MSALETAPLGALSDLPHLTDEERTEIRQEILGRITFRSVRAA